MRPTNVIKAGCRDAGLPQICEDSGNFSPDGTPCMGSQFCRSGQCLACAQGAACTPTAVCHVGAYSCGTGTAVCADQGSNVVDGTSCGTASQFCVSGACITSPNTLTLVSGGGQTAPAGAVLSTVIVKLANGGGTPIGNEAITVQLPPGALLSVAPAQTDGSSGQTSFVVRLGPSAGPQVFTVMSDQAPPLAVTMTATTVPAGQISTIVNGTHTLSSPSGFPGPAILARMQGPMSLAVAANGTTYIADSSGIRIYSVDVQGNAAIIAGGGPATSPPYGDGGLATNAVLSNPNHLAITATHLYVTDTGHNRVRRINLSTGVISLVAGGQTVGPPGYGDGGPGNGADLSQPGAVAVSSTGEVFIVDGQHQRLRKIDTNGIISTVLTTEDDCAGVDAGIYNMAVETDLAFDANGALFISSQICGKSIGSIDYGILRRDSDGSLHHIAGNPQGTTGDGAEARNTNLGQMSSIEFDAAGNLLVADLTNYKVRRIDANTGIMVTVAGNGSLGSAAEYATATSAPLNNPRSIAVRGNDLLILEQSGASLRSVSGAAIATPATITMTPGPTTGTTEIHRLFPLITTRLGNGAANYAGLRVTWSAPDFGSVLASTKTVTDTSGNATNSVSAGLLVGSYHVIGSFQTIHGAEIPGSPMTFTLTAAAPTPGSIFTAVNVLPQLGGAGSGIPGPAALARIAQIRDMITASDGTIYFADLSMHIRTLSPSGVVTTIAGNGSSSPLGDNGPALAASVYFTSGLALDEVGQKLYLADYIHDRVRVIDLTTNIITTLAGGATGLATPWGDGGAGLAAELSGPARIALGPDNAVYVSDTGHNRIRRIDLASPHIITTFVLPTSCSGSAAGLNACNYFDCDLAWDGNTLLIQGFVCPPTSTQGTYGIVRRNADTSFTHILGTNTGSTTEGVAATSYDAVSLLGMTLLTNGDILFTDANRVKRISGGVVTTVAGTTTAGFAGDYGPATSAQLDQPWAMTTYLGTHIAIADYNNSCVRVVW